MEVIKKKDNNNLIDLNRFSAVTSIQSEHDNDLNIPWCNEEYVAKLPERYRSKKNLTSTFNECDGGRVRDSVLEAFDPLLEAEANLEIESYPGKDPIPSYSVALKYSRVEHTLPMWHWGTCS